MNTRDHYSQSLASSGLLVNYARVMSRCLLGGGGGRGGRGGGGIGVDHCRARSSDLIVPSAGNSHGSWMCNVAVNVRGLQNQTELLPSA